MAAIIVPVDTRNTLLGGVVIRIAVTMTTTPPIGVVMTTGPGLENDIITDVIATPITGQDRRAKRKLIIGGGAPGNHRVTSPRSVN